MLKAYSNSWLFCKTLDILLPSNGSEIDIVKVI